ncbi:MAG TPA: hypothetical protein VHX44_01530, partial [Planctomycetota bacterium]|nr:hypothetical protein [Planctomycetota bacterium]
MSHDTEFLADLLSMPAKARAALLVSALDALQRAGVNDLVHETRHEFPRIALPQLLQQTLLTLMAYARAGTPAAYLALRPLAGRSYEALSYHLEE